MGWVAWIAYSRCARTNFFVQGEKNIAGKGREGSLQVKTILWALLAALTTLSSALSLVFKTIPRSLVVETVGMVWVLVGYGVGGCK